MKKIATLCLALLLSLSLIAPTALYGDEGNIMPPVQTEPVTPDGNEAPGDPGAFIQPMDDFPGWDYTGA